MNSCTSSRLQKPREALLPCGSLLTLDAQRHMRLRQKFHFLKFHLCRNEDMAEKAGMLGDKQRSRKKQREKERRRRKAAAKGIRSKELPEEVTRRLGEANLFYATNRYPFRFQSLRTWQYSSILQASLSSGTMPYIAGLAPFLQCFGLAFLKYYSRTPIQSPPLSAQPLYCHIFSANGLAAIENSPYYTPLIHRKFDQYVILS